MTEQFSDAISVETHPVPGRIQKRESFALLRVVGMSVHNPNSLHRVIVFEGLDDGVRCCDFRYCQGVHLSPQPVAISAHRIETEDFEAGTVSPGEWVTVDGVRRQVVSRPYADPVLISEQRTSYYVAMVDSGAGWVELHNPSESLSRALRVLSLRRDGGKPVRVAVQDAQTRLVRWLTPDEISVGLASLADEAMRPEYDADDRCVLCHAHVSEPHEPGCPNASE